MNSWSFNDKGTKIDSQRLEDTGIAMKSIVAMVMQVRRDRRSRQRDMADGMGTGVSMDTPGLNEQANTDAMTVDWENDV
ncbi:hypothetical protein AWRI3579_g572 [Hanseniaspora osmophila]|uniref:Uncharacterized protein n=1 Tax=Hanseniaspora osmophila TaxID=56408 RepID=A0A1E5RTP6_9ASCO|nr:hypothetical protein AWRI3579_g572 [Hanseniaspora osmophila]